MLSSGEQSKTLSDFVSSSTGALFGYIRVSPRSMIILVHEYEDIMEDMMRVG
jgi:hypothetical protein